ncbi:LOW QUALITY PROTEIN: beta-defensin 122-like [Lynx canadensis]|uniref:LOW QUALITY PROTEIN: beta-defensin 122-like n=1 Tax=Lynx canadensis TaxID=61383 RepID=UPI0011B0A6E4|nr:LOW QUALITY PROTEIN: beta-defensin 122-like [Lynx canadensis]
MKRFLLTLAVLLLLSWVLPGSTEKCWNLRGSCREKCIKNEKIYVFCTSGKLCCVKPKFQPKSLQTICTEPQKILNIQSNPEKEQSWKRHTS